MTIAQSLLTEFDQEMAVARRVLERVPLEQSAWKPHPKSMSVGRLASHLAEIPQWAVNACTADELDFAPPGAEPFTPTTYGSRDELLAVFDRNVQGAREAIARTSDPAFGQPWTLKQGGRPLFTMPRIAVLRSLVFSHLIHHRGQLTVFLRLLDVPVPAVYGPSADER